MVGLCHVAVKLEGPVPDKPTVAQVAVVHRAGFDADAYRSFVGGWRGSPGQAAQRGPDFGKVQAATVGDGDLRVKLEEPRHRLVKPSSSASWSTVTTGSK